MTHPHITTSPKMIRYDEQQKCQQHQVICLQANLNQQPTHLFTNNMKTFIFTFALIACLMLAMATPVDETTDGPVEAVVPLVKAVPNQNCRNVGDPCKISDECCSLRCSSYRNRCAY